MIDNRVRLRVNGTDYGGWISVSVSAGIERVARDFRLEVTDRWPGADSSPRVRPGDRCEIWLGPDLVMTGWVDATPRSFDAQQVTVGVQGRSLTADLVDCSAINSPGQWRGQTIERIVQDIARPYGITVRSMTDTGEPVPDHQIQLGESAHESIDRILRLRNILATDSPAGELLLIDVGTDRATSALQIGGPQGNVLTGDAALDFRDRYSEYRARGQRPGDDSASGKATNQQAASTTDADIKRPRVLMLKQSGQADEGTCRDRVDYERSVRLGRSLAATYTVAGWRQQDGALWAPNMIVHVRDPIIGIDREMIIAEVEYSMGEGGTIATLQIAPEEAFATADWRKQRPRKARTPRAGGAGSAASITGVDEWVDFTKGAK